MILGKNEDSVTSIHRHWFFTRINPESYKTSITVSITTSLIVSILYFVVFYNNFFSFLFYIVISIAIVSIGFLLDFCLLRGTPTNKISKIIHVSAFANLLWAMTLLLGIISNSLFNKEISILNYIIEGMFISAGLRFGIFVSVFGENTVKSIFTSFVLPVIFLTNIIFYHDPNFNGSPFLIGPIIFTIGVIWAFFVDRAGRPNIRSTFQILQAFLSAWTENNEERMERIFESKAVYNDLNTQIIKFMNSGNDQILIVLPEVHPGPFNPIGGSNLPYKIHEFFAKKAIVLHSISDHSLNLPSSAEVGNYLNSLNTSEVIEQGARCTKPLQARSYGYVITGIAFGFTAIIIVSREIGMEDIPESIGFELKRKSLAHGFRNLLLVDAHNAMGEKIDSKEQKKIIQTGINLINNLSKQEQYFFRVGFATTADSSDVLSMQDIGQSGIGVISLEIEKKLYVIGWSDSNNIANGLSIKIIEHCKEENIDILDICSSDTHSTSGKRTSQGYYALGDASDHDQISAIFLKLAKKAIFQTEYSTFSVLRSKSKLKVMGKSQFDNYSKTLDKSMKITKISLSITAVVYVLMFVFT